MTFSELITVISGNRYITMNTSTLNEIDQDCYGELLCSLQCDADGDPIDDIMYCVVVENDEIDRYSEYCKLAGNIPIAFSDKLEKFVIGVTFWDSWDNYKLD